MSFGLYLLKTKTYSCNVWSKAICFLFFLPHIPLFLPSNSLLHLPIFKNCFIVVQVQLSAFTPLIPPTPQNIKRTHTTPLQEEKQPNLKLGKRPEQTLLQGGHTEGPETYEKMLSITSHQRDAN